MIRITPNLSLLALIAFCFTTNPLISNEAVIDSLLASELGLAPELPHSWVYSNEGGAIIFAEVDLFGDENKEFLFWRTTHPTGNLYQYKDYFKVYSQSADGALICYGRTYLQNHRKEQDGTGVFIHSSPGVNYDTPDEKAFTEKLTVIEMSPIELKETVHIINDNSSPELRLWFRGGLRLRAFKSSFAKEGFKRVEPEFKWISVKDYLSGKGEWKKYDPNEWRTGFSGPMGVLWEVNSSLNTLEYRDFAKSFKNIVSKNQSFDIVDLPEGYYTPTLAFSQLKAKMDNFYSVDLFEAWQEDQQKQNKQTLVDDQKIGEKPSLVGSNFKSKLFLVGTGILLLIFIIVFLVIFLFRKKSNRLK